MQAVKSRSDGGDGDERDVLIPAPRSMGSPSSVQSIGPWTVVRMIARCPGVDMYVGAQGKRQVLLQVVLLRPADETEAKAQVRYTRELAEQTEAAVPDPDAELIGHGVGERPEGGTALYWALPWHESAELLQPGGPKLEAPDELVILTHDLLERLVRRHEGGRLDPLLSESVVVTQGNRGSSVLGFPVLVDPRWTDEEMAPPRLAAHEVDGHELKLNQTGDLFRLGKAVRELGRPLGALPAPFVDLLRRFEGEAEPFDSARQAIELLERLDAEGGLGLRSKTLSSPRIASAQTVVDGGRTGIDVARFRAEATVVAPPPRSPWNPDPEDEAEPAAPQPPARGDTTRSPPPQAAVLHEPEVLASPETPAVEPSEPEESDDQPTIAMTRLTMGRPAQATERMVVPPTAPEDSAEAATQDVLHRLEESDEPRRVHDAEPEAAPPAEAEDAPGGTVVGVRLPSRNELSRPLADSPETPDLDPYGDPRRRAAAHPPYPIPPPGAVLPGAVPPPVEPSQDVPDVPDVPVSRKSAVLGAVGLFVAGLLLFLGVEVFAPRSSDDPEPAARAEAQVLRPARDVVVKVTPDSAALYSAEDGTFLGSGRVQVLVGTDPPSLTAGAPGYVPVEVSLPQRGTLAVELSPVEGETQCTVEVRSPQGVVLEPPDESAVLVERRGRWSTWELRGAGMFVATEGRGAWVVPCPEPGRETQVNLIKRERPTDVELEVTWPTQAEIFIDGEPQGNAPLKRKVPNRFVKIRAETATGDVERWLPVFADTRVELPEP
jgi:hypothetical protein